ncbi:hypothetical protein H8A95_03090 [Bradyrhizobium sp. Pear76]|uniref:hypothetical protein n=1 Tax=Bradyrhizobium oropedii TaxID=1571201 RepID=UPI001E4B0B0C|nr:hypothetical protein [Bradyrhizobium oropedii]MCC8961327.1 hypothetical protein [Bradyrhizobium oropedii]
MRLMLDSNVYDSLLADRDLLEQVKRAIHVGRLELLTTHVQQDELSRIVQPAKRDALQSLPITFVRVATSGAAWDVSKWDDAEWGDDSGRIEKMVGGNSKHIEDALISATADAKANVLVTNEKRLAGMVGRAGFGVEVWSVAQLAEWLRKSA